MIQKPSDFGPDAVDFVNQVWRDMQHRYKDVKTLDASQFISDNNDELYMLQCVYCALDVQERILKKKIEQLFVNEDDRLIYERVDKNG